MVSTGGTLYKTITGLLGEWNQTAVREDKTAGIPLEETDPPRLGVVVGATDPVALGKVRSVVGEDVWILAPGVGAQGGDLDAACRAGMNSSGSKMLVPVSRGISRAVGCVGEKAREFKENINKTHKD